MVIFSGQTCDEIGQHIRQVRRLSGVSQAALAKRCKIGRRFISDLENGKPTVQLGKFLTLLKGLKLGLSLIAVTERTQADLERE